MDTRSRSKIAFRLAALVIFCTWVTSWVNADTKRISLEGYDIGAEEAARTINLFLKDGSVSADESTNSILIPTDPPELASFIEEFFEGNTLGCRSSQEAIQLLHADAEDVANRLQDMVDSESSLSDSEIHIHPITRTNSVLAIAPPAEATKLKNLIRELDGPPRTVYVSAALLRVLPGGGDPLRKISEIDIDGQTVRVANLYLPGSGNTIIRPAFSDTDENNAWNSIGKFLNYYIQTAEDTKGCEAISRPFVFTADGKAAKIKFDDRIVVPHYTIQPAPRENTTSAEEYSHWERSRSFTFTPTIHFGDEVTLSVQLERESAEHPESAPETLKFSTRLNHGDVIVLSSAPGAPGEDSGFGMPLSARTKFFHSDDGSHYEHLLVLQTFIIDAHESEPEIDPDLFPELATATVSDSRELLKRELKYLPASDFLKLAADAIAHSRGLDIDAQSIVSMTVPAEPESILIGETLLVADPHSNEFTISGSPEDFEIVTALADEIDVRPRSVFISAIIAQVTLGDDIRAGMDLLRKVDEIELYGDVVKVEALYRTTTRGSTIVDLSALNSVGSGTTLDAYVEAVADRSNGRMETLSRPQVFTADRQPATISSSLGSEELLELEVAPLIGCIDNVTLEIIRKAEIADTLDKTSGVPNLIRQGLSTKVQIEDGDVVVLGGLTDGDAARGKELLMFIQPQIIPKTADATGFQIWGEANLPTGSLAFDGDADADGIPNSIEYIFGDREIVASAVGQVTAPPAPIASDVTLSLEFSKDLKNWTEILRYEAGEIVNQLEGVRIEKDIVKDARESGASRAARYYRYRVSQ